MFDAFAVLYCDRKRPEKDDVEPARTRGFNGDKPRMEKIFRSIKSEGDIWARESAMVVSSVERVASGLKLGVFFAVEFTADPPVV